MTQVMIFVIFVISASILGTEIDIGLRPELKKHLHKIAGRQSRGLCPSLAGQFIKGRRGLSTQFSGLMAKVGIDQLQVQSSRTRKFSVLSYHFPESLVCERFGQRSD
jgi:hypothetical protein